MRVTKREAREFAAMVRGDHPDEKAWCEFVLNQLRIALKRIDLAKNEIETIGKALKAGLLDPGAAMQWLADGEGMRFVGGSDERELAEYWGSGVQGVGDFTSQAEA